jgi:hypothetical protein
MRGAIKEAWFVAKKYTCTVFLGAQLVYTRIDGIG